MSFPVCVIAWVAWVGWGVQVVGCRRCRRVGCELLSCVLWGGSIFWGGGFRRGVLQLVTGGVLSWVADR